MVHLAAQTGTTDIVATPHANSQFAFRPEVVQEKLSGLREAAAGLIRIHSSCDFHLHYDNIQDALSQAIKLGRFFGISPAPFVFPRGR